MRQYETMVLLSPDLEEEGIEERISSFEKQISEGGGEILNVDRWGKKRLAYPINDQRHGNYFVVTYKSEMKIIQEIERQLRLDEDAWRFMTVRMDADLLRKLEKNATRNTNRQDGDSDDRERRDNRDDREKRETRDDKDKKDS